MSKKKLVTISSKETSGPLSFHYIKGSDFRTVHVDGIIGAPAPRAKYINMSVFSERVPLPRQVSHDIVDGQVDLQKISQTVKRDGIVRQLEFNLVFDVETAEAMIQWLGEKVKDIKKRESVREMKVAGGLVRPQQKKRSKKLPKVKRGSRSIKKRTAKNKRG